jgi:hypothetical protein
MNLDQIILERIPPAMLERVAYDQGLVDEPQRTTLFKASGLSAQEIAKQIVEAYGDHKAQLAYGLYQQIAETDFGTAQLLCEHFASSQNLEANHQASLVARNPTLPMAELSEFLKSVKRQVCLIVSRKGNNGPVVCGTGFLVSPDLVLTCKHVLKSFAPQNAIGTNGDHIELYFDFFYGEPVDRLSPNLPEARKVGVDKAWHIASCQDTVPDGLVGTLSATEIQRISNSLDFLLLRLDVRIGLQPVERSGGRRRGWVHLPPNNVPQNLQPQDWIIIPQHPSGGSQRIDLGRFREMDQTQTRIRYTANTADGSSGAPCFNQGFTLVGIHNAYVGAPNLPLANQAIRFDHIAPVVERHVIVDQQLSNYALRWSASRRKEPPSVILGREKVLTWLRDSTSANPRSLSDRVYVAQAAVPAAGCSFSIDLLHAEIRESKSPRAVYGERGQQLPVMPEDFLLSLLRELGIDTKQLETDDKMPPRPTAEGGLEMAGEIDKVERWLADELPNWLGRVIVRHIEKKIDIRDAARQALKYYEQKNEMPPLELTENANAAQPIYVRPNAWDSAYIVIDDLRSNRYEGKGPRTELKGEVLSLIAALVKNKPEQTLHPGLRRLRWMFLGYLPDFIPAATDTDKNGATLETLDPAAIGRAEVAAIVDRIWQALLPKKEINPQSVGASARYIVRIAERDTRPDSRLAVLQQEANYYSLEVLAEIGS